MIFSFFRPKAKYYTHPDRIKQLSDFISILKALISSLKVNNYQTELVPELEDIVKQSRQLLNNNIADDSCKQLARSVPDIIYLHKDWTPPLIKTDSGYTEPDWFKGISVLNDRLCRTKSALMAIGEKQ